jgi:hypothetical protein
LPSSILTALQAVTSDGVHFPDAFLLSCERESFDLNEIGCTRHMLGPTVDFEKTEDFQIARGKESDGGTLGNGSSTLGTEFKDLENAPRVMLLIMNLLLVRVLVANVVNA